MTIIPVLSVFYPPALSVWIMSVVDLVANVYLVPTAFRYATARTYVSLIAVSLLTLILAIAALVLVDAVIMQRANCIAITLACCLLMSGWLIRGRLGPMLPVAALARTAPTSSSGGV